MALGAAGALAVLALLALLALPALEKRPQVVADWLGEQLGRPVRLREMQVGWSDGAPLVRLRGLELGAAGSGLALDAAEVRVDALGSLKARALRPESVTVRGAQVQLSRGDDGSITLSGFGQTRTTRADAALGHLLGTLPGAARLGLEDATVTLDGFAAPGAAAPLVLAPVSLRLRAVAGGLRLAGAIALPASPATPLRFTLRWARRDTDPLAGADITLSTRDMPLQALPAGLRPAALSGRLSADLDGSIAGGRLRGLRGTLALDAPRLAQAPGAISIESLESLVEFADLPDGWRLTLLRLQARSESRVSPSATLALTQIGRGDASRHTLTLDHAPVAGLLPLLGHPALVGAAGARLIGAVRPDGRVEDLEIQLTGLPAEPRVQSLRARLREVVLQEPGGAGALGPADAQLTLMGGAGRLLLRATTARAPDDGSGARLDFAAGGELRWHREDDVLVLDSTGVNFADGDARLRIAGSVRVPLQGERGVQVAVEVRGSGVDAAAARRYLSRAGMHEALSLWINRAVQRVKVRGLTASLHGELSRVEDLTRVLRVRVDFDEAQLRYLEDWPALEALAGHLELDRGRFGFTLTGGRTVGASIVSAAGSIPDVDEQDPVLRIAGRIAGRTEHGAEFLSATPIAHRFEGLLAQLDARGEAALDLELDIPLAEGQVRVRGDVSLSGNRLQVPALRSGLDAVQGRFSFDRDGLSRGTLQAVYLERRITAELDGTAEQRTRTRLAIQGATDREGLVRHLRDVGALDAAATSVPPLLSRLTGSAQWRVQLDIPHRERIAREGIALAVTSDLAGMGLDLPAPLGKDADSRQELLVRTRLAVDGPRVFQVSYGGHTRALLEMTPEDPGHRFTRGELRFGGAPAALPAQPGLAVAGELDRLSVDNWVALIAELADVDAAHEQGAERPMQRLSRVDVSTAHLTALGAGFDRVQVGVTRAPDGPWRVRLRGESVAGEILIPEPVGTVPIDARFEHLHVKPGVGGGMLPMQTSRLDPRDLPPARLVARQLRYNDIDLGLAKLLVSHAGDGVEFSELLAIGERFDLRGSGSWSGSGADTRSQVALNIHSDDFGRFTHTLGYGNSGVEGGAVEIAIDAEWQGSPFDFALERVRGVLHFRAAGGRLLEVEPGATGRVFGLLNVTVLPRRLLRLDFSDLFQEGVSYERIEGSFRLDAGNAWTNNLTMHTDSARVELSGRVGLLAEDYDQVMTVTPKLSTSLPLAPLWLAERFLKRKLIDAAFAYRYVITGPWSEPKVERVRVESSPAEAG